MSDTRETLRRGIGDFEPRPDAYRRVLERRDRQVRNRRLGAVAVVGLIALAAALGIAQEFRAAPTPIDDGPAPTGSPSNGAVAFSAAFLEPTYTEAGVSWKDAIGGPRDLYLTAPGGEPHLIAGFKGDGVDQACPAFSPDGTKLAYLDGGTAIMTLDVDADGTTSGDHVEMLRDPAGVGCPQWSPDGDRIAVWASFELRIVGLDGASTSIRGGTEGGTDVFAWSPDGSVIALLDSGGSSLEMVPGEGRQVVDLAASARILPVDGGDPEVVWTARDGQEPAALAWAPDATRLAVSGESEDGPFLEIVDIRDGTRTPVPVEGDGRGDIPAVVAWGSDDRLVVSWDSGEVDLVDPTGASSSLMSADQPSGAASIVVVVSPDRGWLLYITGDGGSAYAVAARPMDGRPPVFYSPWTFGLYNNYSDFSWQPIFE